MRVSNVPHTHIHGSAHAHSHFDAHSHYLSLALALDLTRFVPLQLTVPNSLRYLYHTLFMSRFLSNSLSLSITLCQLSAHSQNEQVYVGQKPMTHLGISLCYPYDFYSRSLQPQFRASVMPVTKILVPISTCL